MAFSLDASKFLEEANEFAVPTRGNNLRRGQAYYSSTQAPGSMVTPMAPLIDMGGTNTLGTAADKENALGMRFAGEALSAYAIKKLQRSLQRLNVQQPGRSLVARCLGTYSKLPKHRRCNLSVMSASKKIWRHCKPVRSMTTRLGWLAVKFRGHS